MKLSICIPTYNRSKCLSNCLQSIICNKRLANIDFQVCVSDNFSTDDTENVVWAVQKDLDIKYNKNPANIGFAKNFLKVVDMADGEFIWLIGDDDLLMPNAVEELHKLFYRYTGVDFFYVNSCHLATDYVFSYPQPFNVNNLPKNMQPFSSWTHSGELNFMDLVNPKISFDFLAGMYLSVFKREKWIENTNVLDESAISDLRTWSYFDNTVPHVKIFAKAFAKSRAYFNAKPLSVCLTGAREWAPMYPFVYSVRLVEILDEYRKYGLSWRQYLKCKNYALNNFIPDFVSMMLHKKSSGFLYIQHPLKLVLKNALYPNFYFSFFRYFIRKVKVFLKK